MLEVSELSKTYGTGSSAFLAVGSVSFTVEAGEFVCIVGPSGAGKTTLLRCMAGLVPATSGRVEVAGHAVVGPPREMALVFQDYGRSLLPWLTVMGNVTLPLRSKGMKRGEREDRARTALEAVGLAGREARYPWQMSGGMQQRVAIARALAYEPEVLLMDEPFASVDAQTRADLEDLILRLRAELGVTVVLVTHDIDESVYLGDRVVVLTPNPCTIRDVVEIPLPGPRDQIGTKQLPEFAELRARILKEVRCGTSDDLSPPGPDRPLLNPMSDPLKEST